MPVIMSTLMTLTLSDALREEKPLRQKINVSLGWDQRHWCTVLLSNKCSY